MGKSITQITGWIGFYKKIFKLILISYDEVDKNFDDNLTLIHNFLHSLLSEVDQVNYYCQISNIRHILVCNKIVDHSDVVGAVPVGAPPTTSSFST